jgi:DNA-binding response OmpR family regulator
MAHAAESWGATDIASRAHRVHDAGEADLEGAARDLLAYMELAEEPAPQDLEVLLVEDNRTVAATVHAYLKRQARRVHVAASAREAEALLATHPIDVMVLDLILPDRDGRDLLVQLREDPATASLPVIVLSGEEGDVAKAECLAVGASDFISKPPDPKVLRAAVAKHCGKRRAGPADADAASSQRTAPAASTGPFRVLLVEDDRVTATLIRHRLVRDGLEVSEFGNGEDALRWAEGSSFDLAILDVKVPGMDGFELLARLRNIPSLAGVPIIMLTGLGGEADIVRGLELGANDYILKPFSPTELLARVRRLVQAPAGGTSALPTGAGAS